MSDRRELVRLRYGADVDGGPGGDFVDRFVDAVWSWFSPTETALRAIEDDVAKVASLMILRSSFETAE